MPRYAVLDIGTHSIKFHIGEKRSDGSWGVVVDRADITRLGQGLQDTGEIGPKAMERAVTAITGMVDEARRAGVGAIAAVGTMGMRTARNAARLVELVRQRCGVNIEVISGDEEGRLAYLAVKSGIGLSSLSMVIFDTGGGSTECIFGQGDIVEKRMSLNVGALRITDQFGLGGPVSSDVLTAVRRSLASELAGLDGARTSEALVGMGGTVTNMTAVRHKLAIYDPDIVQGSVIRREEVERQIMMYASSTLGARRKIAGLQPERADVILAGACIVQAIMDKLYKDSFTASNRGLRHGLLVDRFSH